MTILRVALDVPLPTLFDYRSEAATRADIGYRVLVPFGKKRLVGVIWDVATKSEVADSRLRSVEKILREVAPLPPEWLALAEFCSGYYHGPLGEVVAAAFPPRLRSAKTVPLAPRDYVLTPIGREALAATPSRHRRLRALLERLARGRASDSELDAHRTGSRNLYRHGSENGWIVSMEPERSEPRFVHAHELTSEQEQAIGALRTGLEKFRVSLLFGVTGSGKTEIYLQLIAEVLARGKQVLILVPEIALTPALEGAFRDRFPGACIVTQTSAMAELERVRGWLLAHGGRADIVLGTRLAVFTPLPRLALVVVDEEQDASFKQREGVRYSARMVVHLAARRLRCHHCGLAEGIPRACPECGNPDLQVFGRGTQRIELLLGEKFPQARILRVDSDAVRARNRLEDLLERAAHADILVGTQILAKGHHFERLTLAGVLNADSGLFSSDYRAGERTFAQLQQVAGRAGRANLPGEVLIQTRYPGHHLYQSLVRHDYAGFAKSVLAERREAGFPPFGFEAALRAESRDESRAQRFLRAAIGRAPQRGGAITVFDPAPMSLARLAGVERAQVLLQSRSRPRLQAFMREWSDLLYRTPAHARRWQLDVVPIVFLIACADR